MNKIKDDVKGKFCVGDYASIWLFLVCPEYFSMIIISWSYSPPAFTCWKLTIETLEQGAKYVQI